MLMPLLLFGWLATATDVSITMDDFDVKESTLLSAKDRNQKILAALAKHGAKAALFVVGRNVKEEPGQSLLKSWDKDGHLIANHTFTHLRYGSHVSMDLFTKEILDCEAVLQGFGHFQKLFRFPTLAEGDTAEKRDRLRDWMKEHGYRNGAVTIDASDWYIDQRLRDRLRTDPAADLSSYRAFYLRHIWERAQYYNELGKKVLGREVKHTLLVHFNLLNALLLDDLISMFESKGWKIIDAQTAFQDPVFRETPKSLPSGQSLIWALAKETGRFESELRYPGEDDVYEKPAMDKLGL